jgi:hypothetical protein
LRAKVDESIGLIDEETHIEKCARFENPEDAEPHFPNHKDIASLALRHELQL